MKVKIIRNTVASKISVFEGEVHDLPDVEAKYLISIGKAEAYVEPKASQMASVREAAVVETADLKPEMETAVKPRAKRT